MLVTGLLFWYSSERARYMHQGPLTPATERVPVALTGLARVSGPEVGELGGPALVNIWASWCGPCLEEMPVLERLAKDGIRVVSVSVDEDAEELRAFLDRRPLGYPVLAGSGWRVPGGLEGVPTTLLVDRRGKVAKRYVGVPDPTVLEEDWRKVEGER
jgi:thiol-disulfide isomerase/thioredoxin